MIDLKRLRSARVTLAAVVGFIVAASFGAVRDFVWADLRGGLIDLRGFGRATRLLAWLGLALVMAMVGALISNDLWRAAFPLVVVSTETAAGRGALLPVALVPVTVFLLVMAWSFILTGALHSHPALRLGVLLLYAAKAISTSTVGVTGIGPLPLVTQIALGAVALVAIIFVLRWRAPARPAFEFVLLLLPVAATFGLGQWLGLQMWRLNQVPMMIFSLSLHLRTLEYLALPLLFLIGIDIASFAEQAAGWTTALIVEWMPRLAVPTALVLLVLWRVRDVAIETAGRVGIYGWDVETGVYANALLVPLVTGLVWWGVSRLGRAAHAGPAANDVREAVKRRAMPLIVVYMAISVVHAITLSLVEPLPLLGSLAVSAAAGVELSGRAADAISSLHDTLFSPWRFLFDGAAVLLAGWLARRGRTALALYLGIFGVLDLRSELMAPGLPLARFSPIGEGSPVDFWWVTILAATTLVLILRRSLTPRRAAGLLFLLVMTALLRQTDFLENPFSPFLGFAGIFFLAFGIVWDVLTSGSWANESSPGLPRAGRVFLYVGYVLLTVTVINWALTTHNLRTVGEFTGGAAMIGLDRFGRPLLYAIFAATLASLLRHRDANASAEELEVKR